MIRRIISIIVSLSLVFPSFIRNIFLPLLRDKISVKYTKIDVKEYLPGENAFLAEEKIYIFGKKKVYLPEEKFIFLGRKKYILPKGKTMEKEEQKKQKSDMDFYADTMELEKTKKSFDDMNCQKGLFVNDYSMGLNNDKGVFNSTAIFKTSSNGPG